MKNLVSNGIKLVLVVGLFWFLIQKGFVSLDAIALALRQGQWMTPALFCGVVTLLLGVVRWRWLLQAQKIQLSGFEATKLNWIGSFFNVALPGAVSGDFVKAFYIGRKNPGNRAKAFSSILFDRVVGLSALVILSAAASVVDSFVNGSAHSSPALNTFMELSAAGFLAFYLYLFFVSDSHDPLIGMFESLSRKFPITLGVFKIYQGIRTYHSSRTTVFATLVLSILIHLIVGGECYLLARALGETHFSLLPVYVVVPMGLLVTAIPIAPGGVGTGNLAFLYLFKLIGSDRGADIFSLYAAINIFLSAFGGLVYLRFKADMPTPSQAGENSTTA